MKTGRILSINLQEELQKTYQADYLGGNYEKNEPPETEALSARVYYVNDQTTGVLFGPYAAYQSAHDAAQRRQKNHSDHNIFVQEVDRNETEVYAEHDELELSFWVFHYEKNRRYGPYYSHVTAQSTMSLKKQQYPGDTFEIREEEFVGELSGAVSLSNSDNIVPLPDTRRVIFVRVHFKAEGMGSFKAGRFNTSNGDSSGLFKGNAIVGLKATAAQGHEFSHWSFDGNFGGTDTNKSVRARVGLRIVAIFKPAGD